jgi:hypothetical protein
MANRVYSESERPKRRPLACFVYQSGNGSGYLRTRVEESGRSNTNARTAFSFDICLPKEGVRGLPKHLFKHV